MVERKTFANVHWTWLYRTTSGHLSCSLVTQKCILWAHPNTSVPLNMQFPLPGMLGIVSSIPLGNLSPPIKLISDRWCLSSTASLPWRLPGLSVAFLGEYSRSPPWQYGSDLSYFRWPPVPYVADVLRRKCWRTFTTCPAQAKFGPRQDRV